MTTTPAERPRFRPTPWATVAAALALLLLLGLGTWQVFRLVWKEDLIAFRQAQLTAPAVSLPADLSPAGLAAAGLAPEDLSYRRAVVRGRFLHDRELYLAASRNGRVGFHVITPLRRDDGATLLVDRGWVPAAAREPGERAAGQVEGSVSIEGLLRGPDHPGWLAPDNDPARNYWFWRDPKAMAAAAGVETPPLLLDAGPAANPGGLPVGRALTFEARNDHLQYAITWYALALSLVVIYVLSQRRTENAAGDD